MKFIVLTQGGIHSLDSNFINYMYPSSKMYNYCAQQLEGDISQQHFKIQNIILMQDHCQSYLTTMEKKESKRC